METETIKRFRFLLETIPDKLNEINEDDFSFKPGPAKWSKKEILGHLIDSASNNHQRIIRTQYENIPHLVYDQDQWNALNFYQQMSKQHVVDTWITYNRHLLEVIIRIPITNLQMRCNSGEKTTVSLEWLINDYLVHIEHHLKQIVNY